jgi:manganese transport protein
MGKFAIKPLTKLGAWLIALVLIYLNIKMLVAETTPIIENGSFLSKSIIIILGLFFSGVLLYISFEPIWSKRKIAKSIKIHPEATPLVIDIPTYNRIAIALDFSNHDEKLINYAIGQGHSETQYIILHIVESASATIWGNQSFDYETRKDQDKLDNYIEQLQAKGLHISGKLGFKNRAEEIVRLTAESSADILVMGSHGHKGLKDLIFGQTANTVRHQLKIPVFMVNLKES